MIFLKTISTISIVFLFAIYSLMMITNGYESFRIHMTTLAIVSYISLVIVTRCVKAAYELKVTTQVLLAIALLTSIVFFKLYFWHAMTTSIFTLVLLAVIDGWKNRPRG